MKYLWRAAMCGWMVLSFSARGVDLNQTQAATLQASSLKVMDLSISADAAWQRGTPAQEREDDALLLSWPGQGGAALQVVIPQTPPLIKSDEPTFYRNVTQKWSTLYGKEAAIGWLSINQQGQLVVQKYVPEDPLPEVAGAGFPHSPRWLGCRRPARSGNGVVFHMVTTYQGRAYSVLLFAPQDTMVLPQAALSLLAKTGFSPEKVVQESIRAELLPFAAPTVAPVIMPWVKTQTVRLSPQGEALEALVQMEARHVEFGEWRGCAELVSGRLSLECQAGPG